MRASNSVTVVIPSIPPRATKLARALSSALSQTYPVDAIAIPMDHGRIGAPANRQAGLETVKTEWVAFLDDDDFFKENHVGDLLDAALDNDADFVYSWYEMLGGEDPRPEVFGKPWDNDNPVQTTITTLVKTDLAKSVGFVWDGDDLDSPDRLVAGEDWFFTKGCMDAGAKIYHHPERTWTWRHWGANTSGLPSRW